MSVIANTEVMTSSDWDGRIGTMDEFILGNELFAVKMNVALFRSMLYFCGSL